MYVIVNYVHAHTKLLTGTICDQVGILSRKYKMVVKRVARSLPGIPHPAGGGGGDSQMKQTGMHVRNFELNP